MYIVPNAMVAFIVATITACAWLAPMDTPAMEKVDAGLKRALISFATARALNAVISVAQGTEASIQPLSFGVTLTPGQVLRPIHELVEQFSNLMLAASVVFGVQKVLISIGSYWPLSLALTVAALGWAACCFCQRPLPALLSRLLVIFLMLRFAIPVMTLGTDALWHKYLAADYAVRQDSISSTSGQVDKLIPIPCHETTEAEGSNAQLRVHKERMAPGICVKAFQASQQASTICSYPS